MRRGRTVAVVTRCVILAAVVAVGPAACAAEDGTTPTPVRSTDLTGADGGFDEHARIAVVMPAGASPSGTRGARADATPGATEPGAIATPTPGLDGAFRSALTASGYVPDVRIASRPDAQSAAIVAAAMAGAKVVVVEAVDPTALAAAVQRAQDAGAVVVAIGEPLRKGGASRPVVSDFRLPVGSSDADLVRRVVRLTDRLQEGRRPSGE
ncbi:hypothetical protein DEI81_05195 [Curtobacterium sp. MCBD17_013]|uniref:substrate-binding domain-containing protein n=1 Tax=unclassified Curtobacterium TaxID=257496 RepID=UPI000DA89A59|nr:MULTISPECIES: substrate-binding domain-containing protein [unclassified Curtobacterium]PZF64361.1 hypothetical protein DEI81_05195 [Curtobacterium sp. MCBD17_013]WIB62656.1 substrate-binding domain-containing protein [Curtobacterium sp. MCBD17_040]